VRSHGHPWKLSPPVGLKGCGCSTDMLPGGTSYLLCLSMVQGASYHLFQCSQPGGTVAGIKTMEGRWALGTTRKALAQEEQQRTAATQGGGEGNATGSKAGSSPAVHCPAGNKNGSPTEPNHFPHQDFHLGTSGVSKGPATRLLSRGLPTILQPSDLGPERHRFGVQKHH
jgi:hypothetical protein